MKEVLEFFPMLKSCLKRKALVLSGGQRQMLAMASALMTNPVLMMLDEPATNLAPKIEDMVFEKIKYLNTSMDMTIFIVEQHVKKLLEICEAVYVLVTGKVRFNGTAEELAKSQKMFELFIGVSDL
jgi:branched-chain amino acid transport system ATP-binding protein